MKLNKKKKNPNQMKQTETKVSQHKLIRDQYYKKKKRMYFKSKSNANFEYPTVFRKKFI